MKFDYPAKRLPLQRSMSGSAVCLLMSEGNKTVYDLLTMLWQADPNLVLKLDMMDCRGAQIWAAFYGYCGQWAPQFIECIKNRDDQMIAYVNKSVPQYTMVRDRFSSSANAQVAQKLTV